MPHESTVGHAAPIPGAEDLGMQQSGFSMRGRNKEDSRSSSGTPEPCETSCVV